ncbi:MAG: PadR family transcriptional regulator [Dehalococcoidia bacterium]|nr:PadR family transcriptional regulator [Dehalococcoidia bacterium]
MFHKFKEDAPFFGRGAAKYVILDQLRDKPKHGYEIIKNIEDRCHGFYSPSAGSVYPTLQMLEDLGYARSIQAEGKRVYEITAEGQAYLGEKKKEVAGIHEKIAAFFKGGHHGEMHEFGHEMRDFVRTIAHGMHAIRGDPEKLKRVREAVARARKEIVEIIGQ